MTCDRCGAACQGRLCQACEVEQAAEETYGRTAEEFRQPTLQDGESDE